MRRRPLMMTVIITAFPVRTTGGAFQRVSRISRVILAMCCFFEQTEREAHIQVELKKQIQWKSISHYMCDTNDDNKIDDELLSRWKEKTRLMQSEKERNKQRLSQLEEEEKNRLVENGNLIQLHSNLRIAIFFLASRSVIDDERTIYDLPRQRRTPAQRNTPPLFTA